MKTRLSSIFVLTIASIAMTACNDKEEIEIPKYSDKGIFIDERDGTIYNWVRYGDQEWITENIRFETEGGSFRPDLSAVDASSYDDGSSQKYYDNYGYLYNFAAANLAVPDGWRLPTKEDWDKLAAFVVSDITKAINLKYGGYLIDNSINSKSIDYYSDVFGFYWTSTTDERKTEDTYAFGRKIIYNKRGSEQMSIAKDYFLNVRCVRDVK